ncbi:hypothetical protein [Moorena producens]|uniref:hypothetical protein n=1 Tax=Moorena producens TaxID=1155739 RepID=UPI00143BA8CF|nr:hypothetical protein [Moorena producens]
MRYRVSGFRKQGTGSRFPIPDSLLPTPYSLLPTPYSLLPIPYSLLFKMATTVAATAKF